MIRLFFEPYNYNDKKILIFRVDRDNKHKLIPILLEENKKYTVEETHNLFKLALKLMENFLNDSPSVQELIKLNEKKKYLFSNEFKKETISEFFNTYGKSIE